MITVLSILFVPDNNNYNRFKNSIESLLSCDLSHVNKIIIDGWVRSDDIWKNIENLKNDKISLFRRNNNIGKSTIINENVNNISTDKILLLDSDIIIHNKDTISKLYLLSLYHDIIIPNQLGDNRHYKLFFKNPITYNGELIYNITQSIGVAGGCMLLRTNILKDIPFKNKGPYGSDDVEFFEKAINKYKIILCENISITHPFNNNDKYNDWKLETSLSLLHKDLTQEEIDIMIIESEDFLKSISF
jgi:hypothetical protein